MRVIGIVLAAVALLLLAACALRERKPAPTVRFATFNVSFYADDADGLVRRLRSGDENAKKVAAVIQHVRPDVLLLNEFDYVQDGSAADLFARQFLAVGQHGQAPIEYPHRFFAPVNTGVPSGLDLDRDGKVEGGNDAWGYGRYPGQYGMLILSRYPIDQAAVRSFQMLRWKDMPGAQRPRNPDGTPFWDDETWRQVRLSSKSHWDVPVQSPAGTIHFLVSHPTPPVFDGPENRNGLRNSDEIRLWREYLDGGDQPWLCDDRGRCGGLAPGAAFVIAGDLNADAHDGDGDHASIAALLAHPRVDSRFVPRAEGGARRAQEHGLARHGDTRAHTGDFGPRAGTMRLDYVLPSRELQVRDGGIFWPVSPAEHVPLAGASDHHLVWLDLARPSH